MRRLLLLAATVVALGVVGGCGGDGDNETKRESRVTKREPLRSA